MGGKLRALLGLRASVLIGVLALLAAFAGGAASGKSGSLPGTPTPRGFVGVDVTSPMFTDQVNTRKQFEKMVAAGVESVRIGFSWASAQPYKSWSTVPQNQKKNFQSGAHDVPTDFSQTDKIVAIAAWRHITILPTVLYSPGWDAGTNKDGFAPPKRTRGYANYLTTLIDRYGPHGTFWRQNPSVPKVPIRMWQIWNEEDLPAYWPQPWAKKYVGLLRAAHAAVKKADPGAKLVLGALTNYSWLDINKIEKIHGARDLYDAIALNNFTKTVDHALLILRLMRRSADSHGDAGKPMLATELSWPSAKGKTSQHYDWDTTEAGQARNISQLLPDLAAARAQLKLTAFYWYTWIGEEYRGAPAFNFAGLQRLRRSNGHVVAKPALGAFRRSALAIEGCRKKGSIATSCVKH